MKAVCLLDLVELLCVHSCRFLIRYQPQGYAPNTILAQIRHFKNLKTAASRLYFKNSLELE